MTDVVQALITVLHRLDAAVAAMPHPVMCEMDFSKGGRMRCWLSAEANHVYIQGWEGAQQWRTILTEATPELLEACLLSGGLRRMTFRMRAALESHKIMPHEKTVILLNEILIQLGALERDFFTALQKR